MVNHHPIFSKFEVLTSDTVPVNSHFDFLGEIRRKEYDEGIMIAMGVTPPQYSPGQIRQGDVPLPSEEYFEWIDVLETAVAAQGSFTMIELGAGYGRWLVRGALAAKSYHGDIPLKLIAVEAEPTHFQWLKQHLQDNGIDPDHQILIEAAVDEHDGEVVFQVGDPSSHYGQAIIRENSNDIEVKRVKAIGLNSLLKDLDLVDLIDLDIQKAEYVVLRSAIDALDVKVKRVHIGTHSHEIEQDLRALFRAHGWYKLNDYACFTTQQTEWGEIEFGDGVQTWINPRLSPVQPTEAELKRLQWMMEQLEVKVAIQEADRQNLWQETTSLQQENTSLLSQLGQLQGQLTHCQTELEQERVNRVMLQQSNEALQEIVTAMESSKFWKIRTAWSKFKHTVGLGKG